MDGPFKDIMKILVKYLIVIYMYHLHKADANVVIKHNSNFSNLWQSIDDYSLSQPKFYLKV